MSDSDESNIDFSFFEKTKLYANEVEKSDKDEKKEKCTEKEINKLNEHSILEQKKYIINKLKNLKDFNYQYLE